MSQDLQKLAFFIEHVLLGKAKGIKSILFIMKSSSSIKFSNITLTY